YVSIHAGSAWLRSAGSGRDKGQRLLGQVKGDREMKVEFVSSSQPADKCLLDMNEGEVGVVTIFPPDALKNYGARAGIPVLRGRGQALFPTIKLVVEVGQLSLWRVRPLVRGEKLVFEGE